MTNDAPRVFGVLDIETTGLDPKNDSILEMAWQFVDENFEPITEARSFIIDHGPDWSEVFANLRSTSKVVRDMHAASGLSAALLSEEGFPYSSVIESLRIDIAAAKSELPPDTTAHLTGLSVGFDRSFLESKEASRNLFESDYTYRGFHHRMLDLSSVKIFLDSVGIPWTRAWPGGHRAAADVQEVIEQAKIFQDILRSLKVNA